jgi:hypothetical protein
MVAEGDRLPLELRDASLSSVYRDVQALSTPAWLPAMNSQDLFLATDRGRCLSRLGLSVPIDQSLQPRRVHWRREH